jgi:hypothetical protein
LAVERVLVAATIVLAAAATRCASRTVPRMAICHNEVGSRVIDIPGDQVWCTTARGSVHGTTFAPQTRCEGEAF